MQSTMDKYDEKNYLFGDDKSDKKGSLFVKLMYQGNNYSQALNASKPDSILREKAWKLIVAENYKNITASTNTRLRSESVFPNDIHWEFVDFIIRTACYFRALDKPTGAGTALDSIHTAVVNAIKSEHGITLNVLFDKIISDCASEIKASGKCTQATIKAALITNDTLLEKIEEIFKGSFKSEGVDTSIGTILKSLFDKVTGITYDSATLLRIVVADIEKFVIGAAPEVATRGKIEPLTNDNLVDVIVGSIRNYLSNYFSGTYVTLGRNKHALAFYNNVFAKWRSFTDEGTRTFYNTFIDLYHQTADGWKRVDPKEYESLPQTLSDADKEKYRINARKQFTGGAPIFQYSLPLLPNGDNINRIWYTGADKELRHIEKPTDPKDLQNFLRNLFAKVYTEAGDMEAFEGIEFTTDYDIAADRYRTSGGLFSIDVDKYVRHLFTCKKDEPLVEVPNDCDVVMDLNYKNIWSRNDKNAFVRTIDGKEVEFGCDDPETLKTLTADFKCYSTFSKATGDQCTQYISDCLFSKDDASLGRCLDLLKTMDFYEEVKKDISKMHPIVAHQTLKSFGFKEHTAFDETANMKLVKVGEVDHWLQNFMTTKFTDAAQQDQIKKNTQLLSYFRLLVDYVNSNPTILNPGFSGKTNAMVGKYTPPELFQKLGMKPRREPRSPEARDEYELAILRRSYGAGLPRAQFGVTGGLIKSPFGNSINPVPGANFLVPVQMGGNFAQPGSAAFAEKRLGQGKVSGANLLAKMLLAHIAKLKNVGKTLENADITRLNNRIKQMGLIETDIIKTLKYIEDYNQLMILFKDYTAGTLSVSSLEGLVNHYNGLLSKQNKEEVSMLTILQALQRLRAGNDNDTSAYRDLKSVI
jgi:hypothetical protein